MRKHTLSILWRLWPQPLRSNGRTNENGNKGIK